MYLKYRLYVTVKLMNNFSPYSPVITLKDELLKHLVNKSKCPVLSTIISLMF